MVSRSHSKAHLSGGAIAGVVVAAVVLAILLVAAAFFLSRRRRRVAKSRSHTQLPTISSPVRSHEKMSTLAPQFPNPTVNRLSDKDVERMYLKDSSLIADDEANTTDTFGGLNDRSAPRGKLGQLTGEIAPAPKGRMKPADERRSVPYRPGDFA